MAMLPAEKNINYEFKIKERALWENISPPLEGLEEASSVDSHVLQGTLCASAFVSSVYSVSKMSSII